MLLEFGKRNQPSVKAANDDGLASRRIFVTDRNSNLLPYRYRRRYLRIPAQQVTRAREQKRVRVVRGQRDTDHNIRYRRDQSKPVPMQSIQMEHYGSRRQNTHHRHGLPKPLRVARRRAKQKPHRHDNPNVIEGIHRHDRRSVR